VAALSGCTAGCQGTCDNHHRIVKSNSDLKFASVTQCERLCHSWLSRFSHPLRGMSVRSSRDAVLTRRPQVRVIRVRS